MLVHVMYIMHMHDMVIHVLESVYYTKVSL